MRFLVILIVLVCCIGCEQDVYKLDAFTKEGILQAVIEIPAGTNSKIEYNTQSHSFEIDQENGADRIIQYLPYPGNYGFIPGTYSDPSEGGDGDALDIMVLSSSIPSETAIEVIPIAIFKLIDDGEIDYKIIAIPSDSRLRTLDANSMLTLRSKYPKALDIIETWFLNYNPKDSAKNLGWGDEKEALAEIRKHTKQG